MKRARKRKVSGSSAGRKGSTPQSSPSSRSRDAVMPKLAPPSTLRVQKLGVEKETRKHSAQTRLSMSTESVTSRKCQAELR